MAVDFEGDPLPAGSHADICATSRDPVIESRRVSRQMLPLILFWPAINPIQIPRAAECIAFLRQPEAGAVAEASI